MTRRRHISKVDGTTVVETLVLMALTVMLALAVIRVLRPRLVTVTRTIVECAINEDCR